MKITYIITAVLLVLGAAIFLVRCKNRATINNEKAQTDATLDNTKTIQTKDNQFEDLRNMAFSVTPEQLGLPAESDKTQVYGIIMDWGIDDGIATIVSYQTGDASLYLSSGGGVIGGGQHKNVNIAAKQFVSSAQAFLSKTIRTTETKLPETDEVKFYLLTNNGVFVGQELIKNFDNNSSQWLPLFENGNKVLTEMQKTAE
jgi:hypothetical protein